MNAAGKFRGFEGFLSLRPEVATVERPPRFSILNFSHFSYILALLPRGALSPALA
jgi:hypothetical protein